MPEKPKKCEECGERKPDDEPWMRKLCHDCATERFEES